MIKILQISDLHFGPPYVREVGQALLELAPRLDADAVVISGDLTQRAKEEQFREARDYLARLPDVPQLVVPGNHDVPLYRVFERFTNPHRLYREYISTELNTVLQIKGAVLVGLDSTSPRQAISNGRVHRDQLDFCDQAFEHATADAARIIVAHHHFAPAHDVVRDRGMPKARRAIDRFVDLGVDLILGGHLHRAYIGNSLDFFPGNHRDRGIIIVQSGTSTSRRGRGREREKNSFNLIEIDKQMVLVTHYMYFDEDAAFAPFSRHFFPRPGKRFVDDRDIEPLLAEHAAEAAERAEKRQVSQPGS